MVSMEPPRLTKEDRAKMKQWLDNWSRVGPILDQERWNRLLAMSDEEVDREMFLVLALWQPDWEGDDADEILRHQAVFRKRRISDLHG